MRTTIHVLLVRSHFGSCASGASPHATLSLDHVEDQTVPALGQIIEVDAAAATFKEAFRAEIYRKSETLLEDEDRRVELILRPVSDPPPKAQAHEIRLVWSRDFGAPS